MFFKYEGLPMTVVRFAAGRLRKTTGNSATLFNEFAFF